MKIEALEKLAAEQSSGSPMPIEDRANAALWQIALELAKLNQWLNNNPMINTRSY